MKRILHILIVLLIIFNSAGYVFAYWQLKVIFKKTTLKKIEQLMGNNELQVITASLNGDPLDYENCTRINKKEFRLNNEMYDIVRQEIRDSIIYYYCLKDEKETLLESTFIDYVEANSASPEGTVPVKNLIRSLNCDWDISSFPIIFIISSNAYHLKYSPCIISLNQKVPTPPPKCASRFPFTA